MLYVIYGTDSQKARDKTRALVDSLLKREPDASHFRLTDETFTPDVLTEYLGGQGLFAPKVLVVLDTTFGLDNAKETIIERIKDIAESDNVFIVLENTLDAKTLKKFEKHATKIQSYGEEKKTKSTQRDNTIFKLTDALAGRNTKQSWVLYQQVLRSGARPEEIHGMLFWQVKTLLLVARKSTKGLKPFVVSKANTFLKKWSEDELRKLSSDLVSIYHEARLGKFDLEIGIERLILQK